MAVSGDSIRIFSNNDVTKTASPRKAVWIINTLDTGFIEEKEAISHKITYFWDIFHQNPIYEFHSPAYPL